MQPAHGVSTHAAVDLGATSGRVILGRLVPGPGGPRFELSQTARFLHDPLPVAEELHWNIGRLFSETRRGLVAAERLSHSKSGHGLASIGVDTWAVDHGFLDHNGALLGDPFNYRDARTQGTPDEVFSRIDADELYRRCGLQTQPFNTIFQLVAANETTDWSQVSSMLLIPDLFSHWLTGHQVAEVTNASTTGLLDVTTRRWSSQTLTDLDREWTIPAANFLPDLTEPGTVLGPVTTGVVDTPAHVVASASHDTASAIVSVPADGDDFAYISSGTWSLVGLELPTPVLTPASREANFTNELGIDNTVRYLKNVMGLWVLTESIRTWQSQGLGVDLIALLDRARTLPALTTVVDINDPSLLSPGDMPARIAELARHTGEPVPHSPEQVTRCILDSLALAYRTALHTACTLANRDVRVIHIVGGGSKNELLCQLTAEATGLTVIAGPDEGTALGNLLVQARACGQLHGGLPELRRVVRNSTHLTTHHPGALDIHEGNWQQAERRAGLVH